jgi:hypothetical protein
MEGCCSTGQSPQWAVVPVEEEEELSMEAVLPSETLVTAYQTTEYETIEDPNIQV